MTTGRRGERKESAPQVRLASLSPRSLPRLSQKLACACTRTHNQRWQFPQTQPAFQWRLFFAVSQLPVECLSACFRRDGDDSMCVCVRVCVCTCFEYASFPFSRLCLAPSLSVNHRVMDLHAHLQRPRRFYFRPSCVACLCCAHMSQCTCLCRSKEERLCVAARASVGLVSTLLPRARDERMVACECKQKLTGEDKAS